MHAFFKQLSNVLALLGGIVLLGLISITCISVLGRILNTLGHTDFIEQNFQTFSGFLISFGPIVGDFEIVEAGVAFAIMAFIPLCQLERGHAIVEVVTGFFPDKLNRFLTFLWEALFAFVFVIIAWRLYVGTTDKMRYGETTFMLQFPIWWGYAACAFAAMIVCVVALYSVWLHMRDLFSPATKHDPSGIQQ